MDGSTKLEFSIKLEADESEVKYDHGNIFFFDRKVSDSRSCL